MADDLNPDLTKQLNADLAPLEKQLRGLPIVHTSVSSDLIAAINQQIAVRTRRRDLIVAVQHRIVDALTALDLLIADGWPTPVELDVLETPLFTELQSERADFEAAVEVFRQDQAAKIKVQLGAAEPKPK